MSSHDEFAELERIKKAMNGVNINLDNVLNQSKREINYDFDAKPKYGGENRVTPSLPPISPYENDRRTSTPTGGFDHNSNSQAPPYYPQQNQNQNYGRNTSMDHSNRWGYGSSRYVPTGPLKIESSSGGMYPGSARHVPYTAQTNQQMTAQAPTQVAPALNLNMPSSPQNYMSNQAVSLYSPSSSSIQPSQFQFNTGYGAQNQQIGYGIHNQSQMGFGAQNYSYSGYGNQNQSYNIYGGQNQSYSGYGGQNQSYNVYGGHMQSNTGHGSPHAAGPIASQMMAQSNRTVNLGPTRPGGEEVQDLVFTTIEEYFERRTTIGSTGDMAHLAKVLLPVDVFGLYTRQQEVLNNIKGQGKIAKQAVRYL